MLQISETRLAQLEALETAVKRFVLLPETDNKDYPKILASSISSRTLDLRIIEKQLGIIESVLIAAHYRSKWWHDEALEQQTAEAIDFALTLKKSFGFASPIKPVQERQSAIVEPSKFRVLVNALNEGQRIHADTGPFEYFLEKVPEGYSVIAEREPPQVFTDPKDAVAAFILAVGVLD